MAINNILQTVTTYQKAELALLQNYICFVKRANTKFQNFQDIRFNLGSTVNFDLPYRFTTQDTLIPDFDAVEQRVQPLTVDKVKTTAYAFNDSQLIFNIKDYMDEIGRGAVAEIGAQVEQDIATLAETTAYRCYGDGVTPINSYQAISNMLYLYRNYGTPQNQMVDVFIPDSAEPAIVGSGLNQFVLKRNEEIAQSWELGTWNGATFCRSNNLPVHSAGNVGNDGLTLTVVSTNDPTGANITEITFSGAGASDADAIKKYDTLTQQDGVSGQPNNRFRKFIGHNRSDNKVQLLASDNFASNGGGQVTIQFTPALQSTPGRNQNIMENIVAGMQFKVLPDHQCGYVVGARAMYIAAPRLDSTEPYPSANAADPQTGVSFRMYYGYIPDKGVKGFIRSIIYGYTAVPEYVMKLAFPIQ